MKIDFEKSKFNFKLPQILEIVSGLDEGEYTLTIEPRKEHRTKDANAYFWEFCGKLAAKLKIPKETIYRSLIKEIGDNSTTVCVQNKAVDTLCKNWNRKGLGWVTDTIESKIDGCTNVILYYGSSTYTKEQMSRLNNLLIQECNEQGIDTTPLEMRGLYE